MLLGHLLTDRHSIAIPARLQPTSARALHIKASAMPAPRKLKLPIPVTIITGALGVGKTTALCHLVRHKPQGEVWCVIVNEFGAVGIDAVAIESSSSSTDNNSSDANTDGGTVTVRQIAGGCMCCVLSGPLSAAIAQIIRQVKPDRVIIEPSGLGHPGGLIDVLQGPHLCSSLQLNAIICLVDLTTFDSQHLMANNTAADQITVADVLVGSKADAAPPPAAAAFRQWATEELFPPKEEVLIASQGQINSCWLDAPRSAAAGQLLFKLGNSRARQKHMAAAAAAARATKTPDAAVADLVSESPGNVTAAAAGAAECKPGQPLRIVGSSSQLGQYRSCGWVFDQNDMFDQASVLQLLYVLQPYVARVKGVLRVGLKQWVMPVALNMQGEQQQQQQQQLVGSAALLSGPADKAQGQKVAAVGNAQGSTKDCSNTNSDSSSRDDEQACSSSSRGPLQLQLQPICYRGPSIVEVIVGVEGFSVPAAAAGMDGQDKHSSAVQQLQNALAATIRSRQQQGLKLSTSDVNSSGTKNCRAGTAVQMVLQEQQGRLDRLTVSASDGDPDGGQALLQRTWQLLEAALVGCLQ